MVRINTMVHCNNTFYRALIVILESVTLSMVIDMAENYSIGQRLKELRKGYGLSQERLALQAEITTAYLGQIERGEKNPTVVTVGRLCDALGISLSEFFCNQPASPLEDDPELKQVFFELKGCTADEKQEILKIIQHALKLRRL